MLVSYQILKIFYFNSEHPNRIYIFLFLILAFEYKIQYLELLFSILPLHYNYQNNLYIFIIYTPKDIYLYAKLNPKTLKITNPAGRALQIYRSICLLILIQVPLNQHQMAQFCYQEAVYISTYLQTITALIDNDYWLQFHEN